ncbi:MAG: calcium-binding protein [Microcoleus sp. SIO2G3]|nr:calcium-binding protein [Microcoleus sp. SIO2G3]
MAVIGTPTNGRDIIFGDSLVNFISALDGDDLVFGQGGTDFLFGGNGSDELRGDDGNDFLNGDAGNDKLVGGKGQDSLIGGEGQDVLTGYSFLGVDEKDTLIGGGGADTFVLGDTIGSHYLESGFATITDFKSSEGDKIRISGSIFDGGYTLTQNQNFSGGSALDTLIHKDGNLIAVVQDTINVFASFDFVSA